MYGLDNPTATGSLALVATLLIQYLKNTTWASWFTRETERANLALSILVAGVATLGIHYAYDAATGDFSLVFSTHQFFQWFVQWITQHAAYKGFVVPAETLGEIRGLLERVLTPPPISEGDAKAHGGPTPTRTT